MVRSQLTEPEIVQAIQVNERVIVKQKDGKTIEGRMIEASETQAS